MCWAICPPAKRPLRQACAIFPNYGGRKPLKYPLMYETCDLLVINKIDVLPYFDFDVKRASDYARQRNPDIDILTVSAKTGEGIDALADWIVAEAKAWMKQG